MEFHGVPWKILHGIPWRIRTLISMEFHGKFPWNTKEICPCISMGKNSMEFHGGLGHNFHGIPWKHSMKFHGNLSMHFHGIPWKCLLWFPWNSTEMCPSISIKIHFPWNSFEKVFRIPWKLLPWIPWITKNFMGLEYPLNKFELFIIFFRIFVSAMY